VQNIIAGLKQKDAELVVSTGDEDFKPSVQYVRVSWSVV
jgi:hypothetical protein